MVLRLLFFYTHWCPHSRKAKPIWDDVKAFLRSNDLVFAEMDCTNDSTVMEEQMSAYAIDAFPTVVCVRDNGTFIKMTTNVTEANLHTFIDTQSPIHPKQLNDA